MKILLLNWRDPLNPDSGGAEIVTLEHAKAWVQHGHDVIWFTSRFKNSSKEEDLNGIKIVRYGNVMTVYFYAFFYYFFSGNKFDLVIDEIHGIPFFTPLYVKKPKIAFIHEVAGEIWNYMLPFPLNLIGRLTEFLYLKIYKNMHFWTDANSTIDELVKNGIKRENCVAISCAISNKTLSKIPVKENVPTFIFVSRLVRMKGIEDVIDAFSLILEKENKARLWIVGGGSDVYVKFLKNMTDKKGLSSKVKFWGKVDERKKLELMSKAHILLHASVKEGWGLVVIEAASQYTPSVVYDVAGLRDSVKNSKTGVVISENNPKKLAEEALFLYKDKERYQKYQEQGVNWSRSLSWKNITSQSLNMINKYDKKN
ncbi:MAG: glycosyltransferase family 1 protein [Candidatus Levybacteria bacterium CG10_big_fil_rev_8_21_14_0_10_36_7]|nr:MAG: glycosyltransferase family 1 protein [Candidatus Levybacteria bacterium CG10_big_fil_rev_8_21_14_0_10_36_7]